MSPKAVTTEIIALFALHGAADYDGEPVTQEAHMIQCAMKAIDQGSDPELVLGAFLHDIGHLLKHTQPTAAMGAFGVVNHEGIGAAYVRRHGFSDRVCAVVAGHVAAKRYLVATDDAYRQKLSAASVATLGWQGGPMTGAEAAAFRQHPFFHDIIAVRLWDEAAKDQHAALLPLSYFESEISQHLTLQQAKYAGSHSTGRF